ncbi:MAG: hypothetical protein ACI376_07855 [Candidatus Bruticola sp.]
MTEYRHSSPAAKEALHRILKSAFTAKDIADLMPAIDLNSPITQAKEMMNRLGCPILGVQRDGQYIGWIDLQDLIGKHEGVCSDFLRDFEERPIIHETASFKEVVLSLAKGSPVFVNVMGETAAAICPCDLQDAPMRMWLFGLITLMETLMHRAITSQLPDETWRKYLSPGRLERTCALYDERKRRNENIDLNDCLQFSDKADILLRYPVTASALGFASKRRGQEFFSKLESLRNILAHSQPITPDSLPTIVALAISLDILLDVESTPLLQKNNTTPIQAVKNMAARLQEQNIDIKTFKVLPGVAIPPPIPKGKLPPKTIKGTPREAIEASHNATDTTTNSDIKSDSKGSDNEG